MKLSGVMIAGWGCLAGMLLLLALPWSTNSITNVWARIVGPMVLGAVGIALILLHIGRLRR